MRPESRKSSFPTFPRQPMVRGAATSAKPGQGRNSVLHRCSQGSEIQAQPFRANEPEQLPQPRQPNTILQQRRARSPLHLLDQGTEIRAKTVQGAVQAQAKRQMDLRGKKHPIRTRPLHQAQTTERDATPPRNLVEGKTNAPARPRPDSTQTRHLCRGQLF